MNERIYLSSPDIGVIEEEAVLRAIQSGWVAPLGPEVDAFENEVARFTGTKFGVALSSGTAALHLGLLSLGVGPGQIVITSTMTFVATANAILYTGATPYFIDVDINSGNISSILLEQAISNLISNGKTIGAIIPVDLLGKTANYTEIIQISEKYGIPVLADSAESLGAFHGDNPAGSFGVASAISFNGNKIMTTSGGGMLVTNSQKIAERSRYLATQARQPTIHYEHTETGFNYRLSNVLAALGRAQLSRLEQMIEKRRQIRNSYSQLFSSIEGIQIFGGDDDLRDNCWLTSIQIETKITGWSGNQLGKFLEEHNIESRPIWKPMHIQPMFADSDSLIDGSSEKLFNNGWTLPSGSSLSDNSINRITGLIEKFIHANGTI